MYVYHRFCLFSKHLLSPGPLVSCATRDRYIVSCSLLIIDWWEKREVIKLFVIFSFH